MATRPSVGVVVEHTFGAGQFGGTSPPLTRLPIWLTPAGIGSATVKTTVTVVLPLAGTLATVTGQVSGPVTGVAQALTPAPLTLLSVAPVGTCSTKSKS